MLHGHRHGFEVPEFEVLEFELLMIHDEDETSKKHLVEHLHHNAHVS